jgi:hypothetical protein
MLALSPNKPGVQFWGSTHTQGCRCSLCKGAPPARHQLTPACDECNDTGCAHCPERTPDPVLAYDTCPF